jgi:hypothetical protein
MGTAKKTSKEVATIEEPKLPAAAVGYDYGEDAGAGFEKVKSSDLSIPFLNVMQNNSPMVEAGNAKSGDIVNSVTGETWAGSDGVPFQPCYIEHKYVKWKPRDNGGGILGSFDPEDPYVKHVKSLNPSDYGKLKTDDGNELIETYYLYSNILNEDGTETGGVAVLAFTSTKITPFKHFQTAMYLIKGKPPIYAFRGRMKTTSEKNDKGQSYKGVEISPLVGTSWVQSLIPPTDPVFLEGKALKIDVESGKKKADLATQEAGGGDAAGRRGGGAQGGDSEVPF